MIREMITRYGRNNIGFLWLFAEPMLFIVILVTLRSAMRTPFYSGSTIPTFAFLITGWPTLMLWRNMVSRLLGAVRSNRALLHHRQVTVSDIYLSRLLLELVASSFSLGVLSIIFISIGWLSPPEDLLKVVGAWLLLGWFGSGLALIVGSFSERSKVVVQIWRPSIFILMPVSGAFFLIDSLPRSIGKYVEWVPMANGVEFLRDGWFGSKFHAHYDIGYLMTFNLCLTFVGLSLLRQVGLNSIEE